MTTTITVTRTELSLAALDITASPYRSGGDDQELEFGTVTWRREHARSAYVEGAQLVGAVRDLVDGCTIDVDVAGVDQAAIKTATTALLAAFGQWSYVVTATVDGAVWSWTCEPADYRVGVVAPSSVYGQLQPVRLVFPRQPVPVAGPY